MDISFITSSMGKGGAQRVISVLSERLIKKGHHVRIIITEKEPEIAYDLEDQIRIIHLNRWAEENHKVSAIQKIYYKTERMIRGNCKEVQVEQYYKKKGSALAAYFKKEPTDIIYCFLVEANIVVGLAASSIHARIILAERNYPQKPSYTDHFISLRDKCYRNADRCVFQTKEQAQMFPQDVQDKAVIIPNPVKNDLPEPFFGKRRNVIVNYCGLRDQKNVPLLIDAFSIVARKYENVELIIYGSGDLERKLTERISNHGISKRAKILPFDPNIHESVRDCAMFVMTSDYEGMPNSLAEAMAIGLPCISTDCLGGGAKALIEDGVNGLLVPRGDVNAVAAAMEDLIEHPDKAESLARNAVRIRETLDVEKIAAQWLALAE